MLYHRGILAILVAAGANFSLAAQLRNAAPAPAGEAPAPAPMGAPGPASPFAAMTPEEAVEEAHHQHTGATAERVLDQSKREMKEADVAHAEAGVHVATAQGDKELKKKYEEKAADHKADLKDLIKEAADSKAEFKASEAAYKNVEKVADAAKKSAAKIKGNGK